MLQLKKTEILLLLPIWVKEILQNIHNPYVNPLLIGDVVASNNSNDLLYKMDTTQIRDINTVTNYLTGDPYNIGQNNYFVPGEDFVKLENARKLKQSEYNLNSRLGIFIIEYIS